MCEAHRQPGNKFDLECRKIMNETNTTMFYDSPGPQRSILSKILPSSPFCGSLARDGSKPEH